MSNTYLKENINLQGDSMLKGYRTYIVLALGVIVLGCEAMGIIDPEIAKAIEGICGLFGIYFRSQAIK